MRACEGCRRRKIKCDAATTNTWPCSACKRLKLQCVPPTMNYDKGFQSQTIDFGDDLDGHSSGGEDDYFTQIAPPTHPGMLRRSTSTGSLPHFVGRDHFGVRSAAQLQLGPNTTFIPAMAAYTAAPQQLGLDASALDFATSNMYTTPPPTIPQIPQTDASQTSWRSESPLTNFSISQNSMNAANVREVLNLGKLKIEDTGVGRFKISNSRFSFT